MNRSQLSTLGAALRLRSGDHPTPVYDSRIDDESLTDGATPQLVDYLNQQVLMRSYQGRFVLLPTIEFAGSVVAAMQAHYAPAALAQVDAERDALEQALIGPQLAALPPTGQSADAYIQSMLTGIQSGAENPFLNWLDTCPDRIHHYRNFLIQSGTDLLAEASASALGIVGEYGPPQSALFRILIDEFGYGVHDKKHSVLYRKTLQGFDLPTEYNACWPLFDTPAIALHNTIHYLFQSPRNFFRQIGFLLYAETSYQQSTGDHDRYLRKHHPTVDATYFSEHAHIDIHHSAMVVNEVVTPLVTRFGLEVGQEIILGAELTRAAFAAADRHVLALSRAFHAAVLEGDATYGMPAQIGIGQGIVMPDMASVPGPLQIGALGQLHKMSLLAGFPPGTVGRRL